MNGSGTSGTVETKVDVGGAIPPIEAAKTRLTAGLRQLEERVETLHQRIQGVLKPAGEDVGPPSEGEDLQEPGSVMANFLDDSTAKVYFLAGFLTETLERLEL